LLVHHRIHFDAFDFTGGAAALLSGRFVVAVIFSQNKVCKSTLARRATVRIVGKHCGPGRMQ
jgi:hypothetical protein